MKIIQSSSFEKRCKTFNLQEKRALDGQIRKIASDATVGQEKKGDLRGIYVHKFKVKTVQYLLAYRFAGDDLELIMIGPRENYYRDLKTYLRDR